MGWYTPSQASLMMVVLRFVAPFFIVPHITRFMKKISFVSGFIYFSINPFRGIFVLDAFRFDLSVFI